MSDQHGGGLAGLSSTGSTSSGGLTERFKQNPLGVIGTALQSFIEGSQGRPISAVGAEADRSKREFERRRLQLLEGQFEEKKAQNIRAEDRLVEGDERRIRLDKRQTDLDKRQAALNKEKQALAEKKFDLSVKGESRQKQQNDRLNARQERQDALQAEQDKLENDLDQEKFDEQKRKTAEQELVADERLELSKQQGERQEAAAGRAAETGAVDLNAKRLENVNKKVEIVGRMVRLPPAQLKTQIEQLEAKMQEDPSSKTALGGIVETLKAARDDPSLQKRLIKLSQAMGQNPEQAKKLVAFCAGSGDPQQCMFDGEKALVQRAKIGAETKADLVTLKDPDGVSRTYDLSIPAERRAADLARERGAVKVRFEGKAAELSPGGRVKLSAQRDFFQRNVELANRVLEIGKKDPSLFGVVGKVRKVGQTIAGALRDAGMLLEKDFVDPARQILEDSGIRADTFFRSADIPELELLEISIGIALARVRTPLSQDRVLKVVIEKSIKNVGLTKAKGAEDVLSNVENIRNMFRDAVRDIDKRGRDERPENIRLRFNAQGKQVQ